MRVARALCDCIYYDRKAAMSIVSLFRRAAHWTAPRRTCRTSADTRRWAAMDHETKPPVKPSRLAPLLEPVHAFLKAESAGGLVLMACALIALVWANSPWGDHYFHFWHSKLSIDIA